MTGYLRQALVIARRDFLAVVATPTFGLFLLAPVFMLVMGALGGTGAAKVAASSADAARIVAVVETDEVEQIAATNLRLRKLYGGEDRPPELEIVVRKDDADKEARAILASNTVDYVAALVGPIAAPTIYHHPRAARSAAFLSELAEQVMRARKAGMTGDFQASTPKLIEARVTKSSVSGRQTTAYIAVFAIFLVTLMLAGQSAGMLAEEKSNKVIEILAAAAPLEGVFLGKLLGLFGVAMLFVSFWGVLIGIGVAALPPSVTANSLVPAIGLPMFFALCAVYFTMAYMLLGAVFLGIGGLAGSMREVQMLSMPITFFQVGMFGLSAAAAGSPGTRLAHIAEWFPFSSPFAMAARAANDATLWPLLAGIIWQIFWVILVIGLAARLFRIGVLKSGSWKTAFRFR